MMEQLHSAQMRRIEYVATCYRMSCHLLPHESPRVTAWLFRQEKTKIELQENSSIPVHLRIANKSCPTKTIFDNRIIFAQLWRDSDVV